MAALSGKFHSSRIRAALLRRFPPRTLNCDTIEEYDQEPYKSNEEEVSNEYGYNSEYGSDSQDSDFLVDEENMLDDPEVDMWCLFEIAYKKHS